MVHFSHQKVWISALISSAWFFLSWNIFRIGGYRRFGTLVAVSPKNPCLEKFRACSGENGRRNHTEKRGTEFHFEHLFSSLLLLPLL